MDDQGQGQATGSVNNIALESPPIGQIKPKAGSYPKGFHPTKANLEGGNYYANNEGSTAQGRQHEHCSGVQLKRHLLQVSSNGSKSDATWTVKPFDEVYPGILLGNVSIAKDKDELKRIGVTHVLNAAQGSKFNQIDTDDAFYSDIGVTFLGVPAIDIFGFQMSRYFATAADFIENALCSEGKILVHCQQGLSRSASLVLAFLMLKRGSRAVDACTTLRQIRSVMPNDGFLEQLAVLDNQLYCQDRHD